MKALKEGMRRVGGHGMDGSGMDIMDGFGLWTHVPLTGPMEELCQML